MVLLKEKNETGFHHLYDNYSGALYGVIFRIVQSKEYTEEIIQDVFVKVWNSVHQYDQQKGRFYTWMINIARNTAIDYLKSKGFQNELKNQSIPDFVYNSAELSTSNNTSDFIGFHSVLEGLESDKQELINMAYYQGYTQNEISEQLKIPLGTVKTKMRNALMKLKDLLKDYQ
ncbi:RNA polymerase subunit sigma-70 [Elizabethkingia ursingii]|uniref:RNA polymerase subunit sigma-70 n=1 Tax=Elizabethkingia ursingii TaxID=1756150 RepID=A0AAJ3NFH6_9FLAO|nr:RNA polymerase subunit sigma-70 [Elizabethkingia ursingii]KUY29677.1 RNA polymerase subunit sigma-70 [Elizabethkingia ursingii]OPB79693.1 RNA polymerase subunit sigma-70 [Elizabethkingia ursingii]OPB89332.1 RNA polymerase subunit sigma-70 [Elizabethkingia ursingii]OPC05316.1 RNA polymerase subunit sigma-70 [Elizabethkingia ursingii]